MPNDRPPGLGSSGGWRRDQSLRRVRGQYTPEHAPIDSTEIDRMQWRAAGAQFYPGGALEQLLAISDRSLGSRSSDTDALIKETICVRLTDDPLIDARNVAVSVENGEVSLQGSVEERQQKDDIEDVVADVSGVSEIHNLLVVNDPGIED